MDNFNNYGGGFDFSLPPGGYGPNQYQNQLLQAQNKERQSLFYSAAKLGVLLLLYELYNYLLLRLFYFISYSYYGGGFSLDLGRVVNYLRENGYSGRTSFSMTANLFVVVGSALLLMLTAAAMRVKPLQMLKPYKGWLQDGGIYTPVCITLNTFVSYVVAIFVAMMSTQGVTVPEADFTITETSTYAVVIQLVYVCLVAPIIEELIYRGLIIKLLSPYGKGLAIFFSALIFGLMHENIPQAASAFAGGFIYAAVAVYCGSIAPTIMIHIINNLIASITDIGDAVGFGSAYDLYLAVSIVVLFAGFYGLFVHIAPLVRRIRTSEPRCALPSSKRYAAVFTNIFMIVYFIYIFWQYIKSFIYFNQ